jgi:hypothetical protein
MKEEEIFWPIVSEDSVRGFSAHEPGQNITLGGACH